jgi:hypothetical protein
MAIAPLEVRDMAQARLDDVRAKLEEMKQRSESGLFCV